ncbi:MAG: ABC transporter permease subunit [Anaerolineales bacterium]|nr:ABC transporter permease subunit [Anaerolineales bacterium]
MLAFVLRRLFTIPLVLVLVHFAGFGYAVAGRWFQLTQDPFRVLTQDPPPVWPQYAAYVQAGLGGDWGRLPGGNIETVPQALARTAVASLGLVALAFTLAVVLGLLLGLLSVRAHPAGVAPWLIPLSAVSLSLPSFYIGALLLTASIYYLFSVPGAKLPFPLRGYGWDIHLVLPIIVLIVRPLMQIAQVTATVLADELGKQYVVAGRSLGHSWRRIRWKTALKNVVAPVVLAVSGAFRLLLVELILVEWLFGWPGLGQLLAQSLFRPQTASMAVASAGPPVYLYAPVLAGLLAVFALLFLLGDTLASALVRLIDPRLGPRSGESAA